jgi:hypothetical protein
MVGTAGAILVAASLVFAQSSTTAQKHSSASSAHASARTTSSHKSSAKTRKGKKSASSRKKGQQKIDAQRTTQIQEALIREHYLTGKPSGAWDANTQAALQKYQADNGWQSKTTPDSRALIKLGLGPDHDHLLNPESAMTSAPMPVHAPASGPNTNSSDDPEKPQP